MQFVTRRIALLQGAAAAVVAGFPQLAMAATARDRRFVLINLRGGFDGLSAVVPYGDKTTGPIRGLADRALGEAGGLLDLDGFFGLDPALAKLQSFYGRREFAPLVAVATPYREGSHFFGQRVSDTGILNSGPMTESWLQRAVRLMVTGSSDQEPVVNLDGLAHPVVFGQGCRGEFVGEASETQLEVLSELLNCEYARRIIDGAGRSKLSGRGPFGPDWIELALVRQARAFQDSAGMIGRFLARENGPRVAVINSFGWDTHTNQNARLAIAFGGLANGLAELAAACGPVWRKTVVLVTTEFGRMITMNERGGTGHGIASVAFVLGGSVAGGQIFGKWPGFGTGGPLVPTEDIRAVIKSVLIDHFELPASEVERFVLPDSGDVKRLDGLITG
jgi:uncharacterized protein (DUF1501 family)